MTGEQTQAQPQRNPGFESMGQTALTSVNLPDAAPAHYQYIGDVKVGERTSRMVQGIASFGHMRTDQIQELYYYESRSKSTWHSILGRLVTLGTLSRVFIQIQHRPKGGSPMGCYQIGRGSWTTFYPDTRYELIKDQLKLDHTLFNVDVHIAIKRLERAGALKIEDEEVEPRIAIAGVEVRPDQFKHLDLVNRSEEAPVWIEADNHTEGRRDILDKVNRYVFACNSGQYGVRLRDGTSRFPEIVFVVKDNEDADKRVRLIQRYISEVENVPDGLFTVVKLSELPLLLA